MNKNIEFISQSESNMNRKENLNSLAIPQSKDKISGSVIQVQENVIEPIPVATEPSIITQQPETSMEQQGFTPQVELSVEPPIINQQIEPTASVEQTSSIEDAVPQVEIPTPTIGDPDSKWQKQADEIFDNLNLVINEARDITIMGMKNIFQEMLKEVNEKEAANKAKEQLNIQSQEIIKNNAAQVGLNPSTLENNQQPNIDVQNFQIPPIQSSQNITM